MKKRRILYISMCFPFSKVGHAGGKTLDYYINEFSNDNNNEVTLIAKILPDEEEYITSINKKIHFLPVATPKYGIKKWLGYMKSINSKYNPCYKYGNTLTKEIFDQIEKRLLFLKREGYIPDVIILEWTPMMLFVEKVKTIYPDAIYVASEHDVSFLGKQRKYEQSRRKVESFKNLICYQNFKKIEIKAASQCDLVITQNDKDRTLLLRNGISEEKLGVIAPYFDKFVIGSRISNNIDIIFYGAMNRKENYLSAIWFINNVMPALCDYEIRFIVIGNKPPKELTDLCSKRIIVTGFVNNPSQYFRDAMCLVAPLVLGAGIKVKILEALSSGVPVLTNDIGIEGIDAIDGVHYFHCETPEDYINTIKNIVELHANTEKVSENAQNLINQRYDLCASFKDYSSRIYRMIDNKNWR